MNAHTAFPPPEREGEPPPLWSGPWIVLAYSNRGQIANLYFMPGPDRLSGLAKRLLELAPNLQIVVFGDTTSKGDPRPSDFDTSSLAWACSIAAETRLCAPSLPFAEAVEASMYDGIRHPRRLTVRAPSHLHEVWRQFLLKNGCQLSPGG